MSSSKKEKLAAEKLLHDPEAFRRILLIDSDTGPRRLGDALDPWQRKDFEALDRGWMRVAGLPVEGGVSRAWLERPRGHSKTSDLAVMLAWLLCATNRRLSGVAAAADKDQARLLRDAVARLVSVNHWLGDLIEVQRDRVIGKRSDSEMVIMGSDTASSWGILPDVIICDELSAWKTREFFDSLLSSAAKRAGCMFLVITNAGFKDSWQWTTREQIRQDPDWYFHSLEGSQSSWISQKLLAEQRRLLPETAYRRLWENIWASGSGDALDPDDIRAAFNLAGPPTGPERGYGYVAGLDIGLSRDASAVVVLGKDIGYSTQKRRDEQRHYNSTLQAMIELGVLEVFPEQAVETIYHTGSGRIKLVACKIWKPTPGRKVQIEDIEAELLRLNTLFHLGTVAVDPWQSAQLCQSLTKQGIAAEEVHFVATNLQAMATVTMDTFRERVVDLYKQSDLRADLEALRVVEKGYGFRLESPKRSATEDGVSGTRHGDSATALSLALLASKRYAGAARVNRPLLMYP